MESAAPPRDYPEWRTGPFDRPEDAAYLFGYYLVMHCRDEAMATLPVEASTDVKSAVEKAVDTAPHNVCGNLPAVPEREGGFPVTSSDNCRTAVCG